MMTASQSKTTATKSKTYGKIVLTLYNQLLPESVFKQTPSHVDGLDLETETDLRILGCELVQTAGILLKLPQVAMATGQIYLQRFYYSKSFVRYPMEVTAMASVYLASKIEESPCRIRDVINVFHHIKQLRAQKPISPLIVDNAYIELKNQVIKAERRILKELGFCVHIKHPHKLIVVYLQLLSYEKNRMLAQMSWNYMNDALRTDVFMRFPPENIACACIYLTARKIGLPLPKNPHWFSLFSVKEEEIRDICTRILMLYKRAKVNSEELEKKVDVLRRVYQSKKFLQTQNRERELKRDLQEKSPLPSTSKDDKKSSIKSTTPPLKHHSRKSKHDRRSRSRSYERKRYPSKRHRSRSTTPRKERSRDDRRDEKKRSKKYEDTERSKKYEDTERSKKYEDTERSKKYEDTERSKKYEDTERSKKYEDPERSKKYEDMERSKKYEDTERSKKYEDTERSKKYDENERSKKYDDDRLKKYSDDYDRPSKTRDEKEKRKH